MAEGEGGSGVFDRLGKALRRVLNGPPEIRIAGFDSLGGERNTQVRTAKYINLARERLAQLQRWPSDFNGLALLKGIIQPLEADFTAVFPDRTRSMGETEGRDDLLTARAIFGRFQHWCGGFGELDARLVERDLRTVKQYLIEVIPQGVSGYVPIDTIQIGNEPKTKGAFLLRIAKDILTTTKLEQQRGERNKDEKVILG